MADDGVEVFEGWGDQAVDYAFDNWGHYAGPLAPHLRYAARPVGRELGRRAGRFVNNFLSEVAPGAPPIDYARARKAVAKAVSDSKRMATNPNRTFYQRSAGDRWGGDLGTRRPVWMQRNWGLGKLAKRLGGPKKRRRFSRGRPARRYRKFGRAARRYSGRRRLRGLRKLRRFRRGRRNVYGKRGVRLSKSVQRGVRKIVGDCYNNIVDCQMINVCTPLAHTLTFPWLFGVASKWYVDRSDMLDFMNAFLTTAQVANNQHLYPQNCYQKFFIHNPLDYPQKIEVFKMTIKCNKGVGSAAYVSPTTSTQAGPDTVTDVELAALLWDQSMRDTANTAVVPCSTFNSILAVNGLGVAATVPAIGTATPWEECKTAIPWRDQNMGAFRERLGWIFPKLKATMKVTRVYNKRIPARGHGSFKVKENWPNEMRPLDLQDRYMPTLRKGHSFFYFMRISAAMHLMGGNSGTTYGAATSCAQSMKVLPVQLIVNHHRVWGCRSAGDHIPNYLCGTTLTSRLKLTTADVISLQGAGGAGAIIPYYPNDRQPTFGNASAP